MRTTRHRQSAGQKALGSVSLVIIAGVGWLFISAGTAEKTDICDDTFTAYIVSQSIISEQFPDPGATSFLPPSDPRVIVKKTDACAFLVAARVDYPGDRAGTLEGYGYSMDMAVTDRERGRFQESNVTLDRRTQPVSR